MLRPNPTAGIGLRLLGVAVLLWIAGCASQPPVLYPGQTPVADYGDGDYGNYVDDGVYYNVPIPAGGYYYAPYGPVVIAQNPAPRLPDAPVFKPPSGNGPAFHPPGASGPVRPAPAANPHSAFQNICARASRNQPCH